MSQSILPAGRVLRKICCAYKIYVVKIYYAKILDHYSHTPLKKQYRYVKILKNKFLKEKYMSVFSSSAQKVIEILTDNGYEAYFIGGCVRDALLHRSCNDIDIATNALPKDIKNAFSKYKTIDTGIEHGTVTVLVSGEPFEITTYRIDSEYKDFRKPESVAFSGDIREDMKRRDFTVNAMAMNLNGEIIDYFGGREDLKNKLIKAVGDPKERFSEDALRILRALRFSSVLAFQIENQTAAAVEECYRLLENISAERIFSELKGILSGEGFFKIFKNYAYIFSFILDIPQIKEIKENEMFSGKEDFKTRLAAIFLKIFKEKDTCLKGMKSALSKLKSDNETKSHICALIDCAFELKDKSKYNIKKLMSLYGADVLLISCRLRELIFEDAERQKIEATVSDIIKNGECFSKKTLAISGSDLIRLGYSEGKSIGLIIDSVFDAVLKDKIKNDREELIKYAKKLPF